MSTRIRSHGLSEKAAFEKLRGGLAHAAEACREIGMYRSDDRWAQIGLLLEQISGRAEQLFIARASKIN